MVCPPSGGVECRGACAVTLLLLPALQKWHLGFGGQFFFFVFLYLLVQNLPVYAHSYL